MQRLADQFNAANPGYYVVPLNQGTYDPLSQKINAAITAGTFPDLAVGTSGDLADYWRAGALVPLDAYLDDSQVGLDAATRADMNPELYFDRVDGRTIGLSFGRSEQVLFYNASLLGAAGFDHPPSTWDEFDRMCAGASKPPETGCYAFLPNPTTFAGWVWSRGGEYASADEKNARFDNPAGIESLAWLQNLAGKKWAYTPGGAFGDQVDFSNGNVIFTFGSTTALPFYAQAMRDAGQSFAWGIAPFPRGPAGAPVVPVLGPSAAVFKTTPDRQRGAWLFLRFLLSPQVQLFWTQETTYFPARRTVLDQIAGLNPDALRQSNPSFAALLPLYQRAVSFIPFGRREPTAAAWRGAPRTIITNMLTAAFTGKASSDFQSTRPDEAAREAVRRANQALADYGK